MKIERVKSLAKRFKRALLVESIDVPHMLCLEAVAAGLGFRSYTALQVATINGEPLQWDAGRAADRLIAINHLSPPTRRTWQKTFEPVQPLDREFLLGIFAETPLHLGAGVAHV